MMASLMYGGSPNGRDFKWFQNIQIFFKITAERFSQLASTTVSLTSTLPICTMMTVSPIMSMDALAAPVEETIIHQKFGEMELPEDEETEDVDYSPSDAESDDSLEWASETERTKAEDALVEGKVGIDFYGAAMAVATEYVASYRPVQMGLGLVSAVPIPSIQRAARAARRAGAKNIEVVR